MSTGSNIAVIYCLSFPHSHKAYPNILFVIHIRTTQKPKLVQFCTFWNEDFYDFITREGQRGRYLECHGHYLESLWLVVGPTNQMGSLECQYFASANKMHSLAPPKFLVG